MTAADNPEMETPSEEGSGPRPLHPARQERGLDEPRLLRSSGSGAGPADATGIVDALKSSADQELTIAERISAKARQAFALAAGVFVVAQTVAFGNFETKQLSPHEKHWIIGLGIGAVATLVLAAFATIKADSTFDSGDLPLSELENDLNAAYAGDVDVTGRLGGYYLGVVRTRRTANSGRRCWYKASRLIVSFSLLATVAELVLSLVARIS